MAGNHGENNSERQATATHNLTSDRTSGLSIQHQQALALAAWGLEVHPLKKAGDPHCKEDDIGKAALLTG